MAGRVVIADVRIDDTIMFKILNKTPPVAPEEVRGALVYQRDVRTAWEDHPEYGRRLIARGTTPAGEALIAWLLPVDNLADTWILKTARKPQ